MEEVKIQKFYAVVGLETNPIKVVAVPVKWLKEINLVGCAKDGLNQSESTTVFYCSNPEEQANFSLKVVNKFTDAPACYNGRVFKFEDNEERAGDIAKSHRCVLPIAYTEKKKIAAERKRKENRPDNNNVGESDESEEQSECEQKTMVRREIQQKMANMNNLLFDLSDSDVEDFQNLLDEGSEDEIEPVPTLETRMNVETLINGIALSNIEETEAETQLFSEDNVCDDLVTLNFSGESENLNEFDSNQSNAQPAHIPIKVDLSMVEEGAVDLSDIVEFIPHDAELPIPLTSKIDFDQYELSDHVEIEPRNETPNEEVSSTTQKNSSNCINILDTKQTDASGTSTQRKENSVEKQSLVIQSNCVSNETQSTSNYEHARNDDFARFVVEGNIYDDPIALHNAMHLHFPGECTFRGDGFHFNSSSVTLKVGLVSLLQSWNDTMPFSSNLYDRKFIDLLCAAISKKQCTKTMTNKQIKFVRESYMLRVKNNADRLTRFSDYVQKYDKKRASALPE